MRLVRVKVREVVVSDYVCEVPDDIDIGDFDKIKRAVNSNDVKIVNEDKRHNFEIVRVEDYAT